MQCKEVTVKDAVTISRLREYVKNVWINQPRIAAMNVILLCNAPDKVKVSGRTVSPPAGTDEEYALIARDIREGYHAAAFEMYRPDLDATGYRVLPPYNERSTGLISFLKHFWEMEQRGEYTLHDD